MITPSDPDPVTDYEIAEAMIAFGGGFVHRLGQLLMLADEVNFATLMAAFPEYVAEYRALAKQQRKRERVRQG